MFISISLLLLLATPTYAADFKSHDQIVKEFKEPGHIPQGLKKSRYAKIDEVIPAAKRKKIAGERQKRKERKSKKKGAQKKRASLLSLLFPEAYAACVSPQVINDDKEESLPLAVETVLPDPPLPTFSSSVPGPLPTYPVSPEPTSVPSPSPSPMPTVAPSPSPSPLVSVTQKPTTTQIVPSPSPTPTVGASVDLRSFDGYVRNQFGNSCTAHATIGGMENIFNHTTKITLSARFLWSLYQQLNTLAAMKAATGNNQIPESYWPEAQPSPVAVLNTLAKLGNYKLKGYKDLMGDPDPQIKSELEAGRPVYIAMQVPADLSACRVTIRSTTTMTSGGHAMLIVGMKDDSAVDGGGYWIVKNSWGTSCGDKGYHYFPYSFCERLDSYCDIYAFSGVIL